MLAQACGRGWLRHMHGERVSAGPQSRGAAVEGCSPIMDDAVACFSQCGVYSMQSSLDVTSPQPWGLES